MGSRGKIKPYFERRVNILSSKVYCVGDKITLCANNAEPVSNLDPIVGIGLTYYGIEGIGNCFVSRCFFRIQRASFPDIAPDFDAVEIFLSSSLVFVVTY
jgi:hypothetical protein